MKSHRIWRWQRLWLALGLGQVLSAGGGLESSGAEQTIRLPETGVKLTNDPPFDLAATASSGLPLSYEVVAGTNVAAVSGATVTLSGQGVATIRIHQAGDVTFSPAAAFLSVAVVGSDQLFQHIAAGQYHVVGIKRDGTLWTWGDNGSGQLGLGTGVYSTNRLAQVGVATDWQAAASGLEHTVAIKTNGTLWAWGGNPYGQLGLGHQVGMDRPTQVGGATDWASVAAGSAHTLALKRSGTLWAWGDNGIGQLGNGTLYLLTNRPAQVGTATDWVMAAGGDAHSLGIKRDGSLWAWGANVSGELGLGVTFTFTNRPARVGVATDWAFAVAGESHSLGLKRDGTLWAWGRNVGGQLGVGSALTHTNLPVRVGLDADWKSVAAGLGHSLAVKSNGTLWSWGGNNAGQLGIGGGGGGATGTNRPVQVGSSTNWVAAVGGAEYTAAIQRDGTLWTWGSSGQLGYHPRALIPAMAEWGSVVRISAGASHSVVVKRDGTVWSWGANTWGQLGGGLGDAGTNHPFRVDLETNWMAVAAGNGHSIGVRSNGTLWAWGLNFSGQLGLGRIDEGTNQPTRVGADEDWADVAASEDHSMGLKRDGTLLTWGANSNGELGHGNGYFRTNRPGQVGATGDWRMVAAGYQHMVALKRDGSLWAWGRNAWGQLGNGSNLGTNRPVQVIGSADWKSVAAGGEHSAGIRSDGTLWTWGLNFSGQLGHGNYGSGTNRPVQVGTANDWQAVAAGSGHTLALKRDGALWAWGWSVDGESGGGLLLNTNRPVQVGNSREWRALAAGGQRALFLTADGTPWQSGQLRDSRQPGRVLPDWFPQSMSSIEMLPVGGQGLFQLRARPSSGLPARFGLDGPATVSGDQLSVFGSGLVTMSGYQEGDDFWDAAEPVGMQARFLVAGRRIPDALTVSDLSDPTRPEAVYFMRSYWLVRLPGTAEGEFALYARDSNQNVNRLLRVYDFDSGTLMAAATGIGGEAMAVFEGPTRSAYTATVSTTEPGQTGDFELGLYPVLHRGERIQGTLDAKDPFSDNRTAAVGAGRWAYDDYLLPQLRRGERLKVQVEASSFAPFIEVRLLSDLSPQRYADASSLDFGASESGPPRDYLVRVTSSASGALGDYTLRVEQNSAGPEVWGFRPASGVPGTWVTVRGTNFLDGVSPLVTDLQFGGVSGSLTEPTDTGDGQEFLALVPPGAVTGPITVLTQSAEGRSTNDFIVLAPVGGVRLEADGRVSFGVSNAVPGIENVVEAAGSLTHPIVWSPIATNAVGTPGVWRYTNAGPGARREGYYRVKVQ